MITDWITLLEQNITILNCFVMKYDDAEIKCQFNQNHKELRFLFQVFHFAVHIYITSADF